MKKFSVKDIEPVEVLEAVLLPFPHYSDEMSIEERPIANIYRYRFDNDLGVEFSFVDKISSGHCRFLLYKKDSNVIEKFGNHAWSHRETMRRIVKICKGTTKKDKDTAEKWMNDLLSGKDPLS